MADQEHAAQQIYSVNIACGDVFVDGWLNLDFVARSSQVVQANLLKRLPLRTSSVDVIYSSHFLEHVPMSHVPSFLRDCFRALRPGGRIRLVVPDLEELCLEYLRQRRSGEHWKADFVVIEMLDQCVRSHTGGKLNEALNDIAAHGSEAMVSYVRGRLGDSYDRVQTQRQATYSAFQRIVREPRLLRAKALDLYTRLIGMLLPTAYREQNISRTALGEKHTWIWDYYQLSSALSDAGFVNVVKVSCRTSSIMNFPCFPLDMLDDGSPRKGLESMYVEAEKP
ncbi:MAG: methyltransferase domain-containing protein [Nitrospiraceae bacterium]